MASKPAEAPPPYTRVDPKVTGESSHLRVPRNDIPIEHRRSMEDERRELPAGWVRQFDPQHNHHFYVDTRSTPHRSIWHHPYDDDEFLSTLPSAERERLQELTRHSSVHDIIAESSDDESHTPTSAKHSGAELPPRPSGSRTDSQDKKTFGRKMKDKITNSTHEERETQRKQRAEEERRAYQEHLMFRRALQKAMETGQPQLIGKDRQGKDVYVEPPSDMMGGGYGYGGGGYGYNAFRQGGMYARPDPNARYIRPQSAYSRPYGYGYGGGYGMPLALGGGLAGGMMLGGMMGGMGGFGL